MSVVKKVSIYEIAKIAGVSPSTVSRALKDHPTISQLTKQKIHDISNRLKNNNILSLNKNASLKLCFYTETWNVDVLYKAMHNKIVKTKHEIIFIDNKDCEMKAIDFRVQNFDGIIFLGVPTKLMEIVPEVKKMPAVKIFGNEAIDDFSVVNITYNSYQVASIMIKYLKEYGKHIYYINNKKNHSINVLRRESLINYHAKLNGCDITNFNYDKKFFGKDIEDFVDTLPRDNGDKLLFACYDDEIMEDVFFWLSRHGLKYEEDYMIIGCNNSLLDNQLSYKLVTIDLQFEYIAEIAIDELIKKIQGDVNLNYTLSLEPKLILN